MGLYSATYAITAPIDVERLVSAIEASTGEHTSITREASGYAALTCRWIGGVAELAIAADRVQLEIMLPTSAYFLAHVEAALVAAGARRMSHDGSPDPRPPDPLATRQWRSLPLGQRLAGGWAGQTVIGLLGLLGQLLLVLALPLIVIGAGVRAVWRRIRGAS